MSTKSIAMKTAAGLAVAALALTGCSSTKTEATADNPLALKDKSKLTVCSDVPYAPFEFQDPQKKVVGFDMDIANTIAKDIKATPEVRITAFEQIQSGAALQTNECDVALSSISITDERKTKMDFSNPYYEDNLGLMVPKGSSVKDLESAKSVKVGVQAGTTGAAYAKKNGISATEFKDTGLLIQALKAGSIQAALGNKSTLGYTAGKDSSLLFAQEYKSGERLGVALKKDNKPLLEQVNKSLKEYTDSGKLEESKKKWFGAAGA